MHFWRWFPFFARWEVGSFPGEQLRESALLLYLHGDNMETTLPKGNPKSRIPKHQFSGAMLFVSWRLIHHKDLKVEFRERGFFGERLKTIQTMKERVPPLKSWDLQTGGLNTPYISYTHRQHEEMLGGASGSDVALTAYVTSALAKAAGRRFFLWNQQVAPAGFSRCPKKRKDHLLTTIHFQMRKMLGSGIVHICCGFVNVDFLQLCWSHGWLGYVDVCYW